MGLKIDERKITIDELIELINLVQFKRSFWNRNSSNYFIN
jgi:hypothetical protein